MLGGLRKSQPRSFLRSILCLPKATGCQLLEAATSVGCRFLGSSQASDTLDRAWTLQCFRFNAKCHRWTEFRIKIVTAMHSQCRCWVISDRAIAG